MPVVVFGVFFLNLPRDRDQLVFPVRSQTLLQPQQGFILLKQKFDVSGRCPTVRT